MPSSVLEFPFGYTHLTETTQVSTAKGTLHSLTINRPDPAAGANITLYDSAAGADVDSILAIVAMDSALFVVPVTLTYDIEFENGLYVEFSAGFTLGDITLGWR